MEAQLLLRIHGLATPALDTAFRLSHVMGSLPLSTALVCAMAVWNLARGRRREALAWLIVGLTTFGLLEGLKALVGRPRPQLWSRIIAQDGFSFPSGHALASATFYPLLAWTAARRWPGRAALAHALAIAAAFFVGFGRLYLGVHWPSDVVAGWTLGALQSVLAAHWLSRPGRTVTPA